MLLYKYPKYCLKKATPGCHPGRYHDRPWNCGLHPLWGWHW